MKVQSKALSYLEQLKIPFTVKGREALLNDYDSLKISLDNKRLDSWKRYSTGDSGKSGKDLITYLLKVGIITKDEALLVLGSTPTNTTGGVPGNQKTFSVEVEDVKPFSTTNQVSDPRAWNLKRYLTEQRKINPIVVDALINKNKIIEDGRGSIRFLWYDNFGNNTGAEVVSTGKEKLRYIVSGSKGLFYQVSRDIEKINQAERIILFEAPIDMISYLEIIGYPKSEGSQLPEVHPKTAFISMSGSVTKVNDVLKNLAYNWGVKLNSVQIVVATDSDKAGDEVYDIVKKNYPNAIREKVISRAEPLKDWNDLLVAIKEGRY